MAATTARGPGARSGGKRPGVRPLVLLSALVALLEVDGRPADHGLIDHRMPDASSRICWVGGFSKERCCQGDALTTPECWKDHLSFSECCPNSDCWEGSLFSAQDCCDTSQYGNEGNAGCWSSTFTYDRCCLANATAQSWVDVLVGDVDPEQFYGMDEFYSDAQYGEDFGYYSTGRVLGKPIGKTAQEFAHYTTFPMALAPHFGRVLCRLLFLMWLHLEERAPFRVVEMGAGSGQLAVDIQQCVRQNALGISPPVWRRWVAAFEYLILERSPALAKRQRERGLKVINGDAQTSASCGPALAALAASDACGESAASGARAEPECQAGPRGTQETGASVVLNNELLDAFAPVKLRLNLHHGHGESELSVTDCAAWQELRFVHAIAAKDLRQVTRALSHSEERTDALLEDLQAYTKDMFCHLTSTTVGQAAQKAAPDNSSCLALVLGLGELTHHVDLQLPSAAHTMRLRLKQDRDVISRLHDIVARLDEELRDVVVLPKGVYQHLRHELGSAAEVEMVFLTAAQTRQIPAPITERRCSELSWWFARHKERVLRLASLYRPLGYQGINLVVRPGEKNYMELADCLTGPTGGFMLSIDYGASFEALGNSLSVDTHNDGIFLPPVPQELLEGLPDCYADWTRCAGRVDWTTFVDFTNVAAAGEQLGWRTLFYGPQSLLEHISRRNITVGERSYSVPGYSVLAGSWPSRHVQNWYGREALSSKSDSEGWQQRWTSFKALVLERPADKSSPKPPIVSFPSWHLDDGEIDECWKLDPTSLPLPDWVRRQGGEDPRTALDLMTEEINDGLGKQYGEAYEDTQLAVRLVDWLVATEGCPNLKPRKVLTTLNSRGLWLSMRARLLRAWEDVWGAEAVERVALGVLRRLAERPDLPTPGPPSECMGQKTYIALCEDPGDGVQSRAPTYSRR